MNQESQPQETQPQGQSETVPFWQKVLENPFLLLFIGIAMPTVFYILWGVIEISNLPIAE